MICSLGRTLYSSQYITICDYVTQYSCYPNLHAVPILLNALANLDCCSTLSSWVQQIPSKRNSLHSYQKYAPVLQCFAYYKKQETSWFSTAMNRIETIKEEEIDSIDLLVQHKQTIYQYMTKFLYSLSTKLIHHTSPACSILLYV